MASKKSKSWNGFKVGDTVHFNDRNGHPKSGKLEEILPGWQVFALRVRQPGEMFSDLVKSEQVRGGR